MSKTFNSFSRVRGDKFVPCRRAKGGEEVGRRIPPSDALSHSAVRDNVLYSALVINGRVMLRWKTLPTLNCSEKHKNRLAVALSLRKKNIGMIESHRSRFSQASRRIIVVGVSFCSAPGGDFVCRP